MAEYIKKEDAIPYLIKYIPSVEAVERSKIDEAIEEIEVHIQNSTKLPTVNRYNTYTEGLKDCLDILKRNIGEEKMIKPKLYKAKLLNRNYEVTGVYYCYPETTYCFTEDYVNNPVKTKHVIIKHEMTDWGLPNELRVFEIDPDTLEEVE